MELLKIWDKLEKMLDVILKKLSKNWKICENIECEPKNDKFVKDFRWIADIIVKEKVSLRYRF